MVLKPWEVFACGKRRDHRHNSVKRGDYGGIVIISIDSDFIILYNECYHD